MYIISLLVILVIYFKSRLGKLSELELLKSSKVCCYQYWKKMLVLVDFQNKLVVRIINIELSLLLFSFLLLLLFYLFSILGLELRVSIMSHMSHHYITLSQSQPYHRKIIKGF